jgi:protein TonB
MTNPVESGPQAAPQAPQTPERHDILPTLFGEGYGMYAVKRESFVASFLFNVVAVLALFIIGSWVAANPTRAANVVVTWVDTGELTMPAGDKKMGGGGGGGDHDKLQASKGALPRQSMEQITPPAAVIRNDNPKLAVEATVVVPPSIQLPHNGPMGDPLSGVLGPASNGTGSGAGIGSGSGGGVGSGSGPGFGPGHGGGYGGGAFMVGNGVSAPRALFAPDPEYSEEARKARWQGTCVVWVVVGPDGRTHEMRVQRSLGLGLDEKAMEAVKQWRFEPAKKDGQNVAVQILVEVNFRLY